MNILVLIIGSILSAVLYRLGGIGGKWYLNTKIRDIGCSLVTTACIVLMFPLNINLMIAAAIHAGLLFGSLTTYNKWVERALGKHTDPANIIWYCWLVTGLFYGLAALPLVIVGVPWYLIGARMIALGVLITVGQLTPLDGNVLEPYRGALIPASLFILTLFN